MNVGKTPQNPIKGKLFNNKFVLHNEWRLTTDSGCSNWINKALRADPGYLRLHHKTIQSTSISTLNIRVCKFEFQQQLKACKD